MPNGRGRGIQRERDLRELLENCGWLVVRSPGSLGPVDLLAIATGQAQFPAAMRAVLGPVTPYRGSIMLIQAKSTQSTYAGFGPRDRRVLLEVANSIAAAAWLAWKPKGATRWKWIPAARWPAGPAPAAPAYAPDPLRTAVGNSAPRG